MFELTMKFLSNPHKVWQLGVLEHKRSVLKLTFANQLHYDRKSGFRTPKMSIVFNALEGVAAIKKLMAEREGFEPSIESPLYSLSRGALSAAQPPLRC